MDISELKKYILLNVNDFDAFIRENFDLENVNCLKYGQIDYEAIDENDDYLVITFWDCDEVQDFIIMSFVDDKHFSLEEYEWSGLTLYMHQYIIDTD